MRIAARASSPTRWSRSDVHAADRVGTLAWNGYRHFEIYYAVSGIGAVCHTINPRLFPEQIAYIVNHADDQYVFFDLTFVPLVEKLRRHCKQVKGWVADDRPRPHAADQARQRAVLRGPDRRALGRLRLAAVRREHGLVAVLHLGHDRQPEGRAVLAIARRCCTPTRRACPMRSNLSARDVVLPVVPMFHVNAWGLPYSCALAGAKLVFPGAGMDGASLYELFENGEGHGLRRRADGLAGAAQSREAEQPQVQHVQPHGDRRLGLPAGDDPDASRKTSACACCTPGA